jgi:hypothetical protein
VAEDDDQDQAHERHGGEGGVDANAETLRPQ